ncbi:MAG: hypothetical protein QG649_18 [Patescibacteria group bacterium]|jgi:hypothetical protein|nr:hypothetical protein [Patescibacteria group bacterium]
MSLNQEYGDTPFVPVGISGDRQLGHESGSEASRQALIAQQAFYNEMLDRQAAGLTTPDEELEIARRIANAVAHDYN